MLHVELFGRFAARCDTHPLPLRDGSKAQELFAYLLLNGQRPQTREAVASVLWDRCATATSMAYLRKALWQLRSALEKCERSLPQLIEMDPEWIQVHPAKGVFTDVILFERAYQSSRGADGASLSVELSQSIEQAVALYRGGLLPNRYESWCLLERERFQQMYLMMRDKLMDYYMIRMQYEEAMEQGNHILRCDSTREHTHRRLMWTHHLRRDRTSALRQFRVCKQMLEVELGVEPDKETLELYERIRDGSLRTAPPEAPAPAEATSADVRDLRTRLDQIQRNFSELARQTESLVLELTSAGQRTDA